MTKKQKETWRDPELRERQSEKLREVWQNQEYRKRKSEITKKRWEDPELRERQSENTKKQWEDPEFCALHSKPILQLSLDGTFVREWPSASQAGRELGIKQANITKVCQGKRNKAGGYIWKYKTQV